MATLNKSYTFVADTLARAEQVNQNFDEIVAFLNSQVLHVDGSKAMEGQITLPPSDPTTNNQATRKAYVDAQDNKRLKVQHSGYAVFGGTPPNEGLVMQAGTVVAPTDGNGNHTVVFPQPFPNGVLTVVVSNGDSQTIGRAVPMTLQSYTNKNQFVAHWVQMNTDANHTALVLANSPNVRLNWIAIGW